MSTVWKFSGTSSSALTVTLNCCSTNRTNLRSDNESTMPDSINFVSFFMGSSSGLDIISRLMYELIIDSDISDNSDLPFFTLKSSSQELLYLSFRWTSLEVFQETRPTQEPCNGASADCSKPILPRASASHQLD